jgi:undecaprenyl-diphosphatase
MSRARLMFSVQRVVGIEMAICLTLNRFCYSTKLRELFALVSWLGDGKAWYFLIAGLPLFYGFRGFHTSLQMVNVGILNIVLYKLIKTLTGRSRPCTLDNNILLGAAPLDQYSFPSGHTMHAVAFSTVAVAYHPELVWLLVPFASLIALSRIVLGLHFPSDVFVGAVIGGVTATFIPGARL